MLCLNEINKKSQFTFKVILFARVDGDEPFDTDAHNMLVQFLNNCEDVYKSG